MASVIKCVVSSTLLVTRSSPMSSPDSNRSAHHAHVLKVALRAQAQAASHVQVDALATAAAAIVLAPHVKSVRLHLALTVLTLIEAKRVLLPVATSLPTLRAATNRLATVTAALPHAATGPSLHAQTSHTLHHVATILSQATAHRPSHAALTAQSDRPTLASLQHVPPVTLHPVRLHQPARPSPPVVTVLPARVPAVLVHRAQRLAHAVGLTLTAVAVN